MGKEGYCLLHKHLQQHLHKASLKWMHMASIQKLIACRAAAPGAPPADKGRKEASGENSGKNEEHSAPICHDYRFFCLFSIRP
jgi:hypothetical protein